MFLTTSWIADIVLLCLIGIYILYKYTSRKYSYWEERGVYNPTPSPIVGNIIDLILFRKNVATWIKDQYDEVHHGFFGVFIFDDPYLILKDPELIKNVLIKDSKHFPDRNIGTPDHCQITANGLFNQKSPAWKTNRSRVSTVFTPVKLKAMFPLVENCVKELKKYIIKNNNMVIEARELSAKYTTDVVSLCTFGINAHCFEDKDSEFRRNGKEVFEFTLRNAISQFIYFFKPTWVNPLKLYFLKKETIQYFAKTFLETAKNRKEGERYNDLIDIIKDMIVKKELKEDALDELDICGTPVQFFVAGVETSSATISFTLYELAMNVDCQNKARSEALTVLTKYGGITYEAIYDSPYLDLCINETMRKYPVLPFFDRKCVQDYKIPNSDVIIKKDIAVLIPVYGLHMDEEYFPDPHKYNPDRFNSNKNISEGFYLPFGEGPRRCLGEKFGIIITKMALLTILTNFRISKCSETPEVVVFEPKSFLLQSKVGLPIKLTALDKEK